MNSRTLSRTVATPRALFLSLCSLVLFASTSHAQGGWNRHLEAVTVTPTYVPDNFFDVDVVWTAHLSDPLSTSLDLTSEVELSINGVVVASSVTVLSGDPGSGFCTDGGGSCGGSCGTGSVDGQSATLLCLEDGPCPIGDCDCHCAFPMITSSFPSESLQPGDEIMVILRPAPGAVPEPDSSDDMEIISFDGNSIFWDREITSASVDEVPGGPGLYQVHADGAVRYSGMLRYADTAGEIHLSAEALLQVNGTVVASTTIPMDPLPWFNICGCVSVCGMLNGAELLCQDYGGQCACEGTWNATFPPTTLQPGDEIMVLLRPAPGALPELPGLPEDDEFNLTCCGATGVAIVSDSREPLHLGQNQPNPFRANTQIAFDAVPGASVTLAVYDVQGRRIRTLLEDARSSTGAVTVAWDATDALGEPVPSGVYFYRLQADGVAQTRKMTVTR